MEQSTDTPTSSNPRREYMRAYQNKRYNADVTQSRKYKNSLRFKKENTVTAEEAKELGAHLCDYKRALAILETLPTELVQKLMSVLPTVTGIGQNEVLPE